MQTSFYPSTGFMEVLSYSIAIQWRVGGGTKSLQVHVKTEGQAMLVVHSRSQELVSET